MGIKDFKVGQKVYVKLINNVARGRDEDELIQEWEVVKIGKKFLTAKNGYIEYQFYKHDFYKNCLVQKTDYSPDYLLYNSLEEIKEEEKRIEKEDIIGRYFRSNFNLRELSNNEVNIIYEIVKDK